MQTIEYERPWMYAKQLAAIFCPERVAVIEATTKSGKTYGCLVWAFEQALMTERPDSHVWWIAPIVAQAKDPAFSEMKMFLAPQIQTGEVGVNETERWVQLPHNGCKIWFKGSDEPNSLYGQGVIAAVIDEASRCREEAFHAVWSTLTTTMGPLRIIGNVKGRLNWAYQQGLAAKSGKFAYMHYARITARDAVDGGVMPLESVDQARERMPKKVFQELYEAIPADDTGCPFERNHAPMSKLPVVAWGWDLAKKQDYTTGIGLDMHGHVAAFYHFQKSWVETFETIKTVTKVPALIDSTGVGDPIVEMLQKAVPDRFTPFIFSSNSKQRIMEGLALAISQKAVAYPQDSLIDTELQSFEYETTRTGVHYGAAEGMNDDCVCALAMAVECKRSWTLLPVYGFPMGIEREEVPTWKN